MDADDPRMDSVECAIARIGYAHGQNGLEIAEQWINNLLDALLEVRAARAKNPEAFPGFGDGTSTETTRRIIARLLDAGWRPADAECLDLPEIPEARL